MLPVWITSQIPKAPITEYRVPVLQNSLTGKKYRKQNPLNISHMSGMEEVSCGICVLAVALPKVVL